MRAHVLRDRPPAAHTGGFGEPTCHVCHSFYDLNSGAGRIELKGLPTQYEPGRRYALELVLHHPQVRTAGFEVAVRFADGAIAGKQAGSLESADSSTAVTDTLGIQYLHHLRAGTSAATPGSIAWRFVWTAPDRSGPAARAGPGHVRLDIAANASDNDNSELGDFVYTRSERVEEGHGGYSRERRVRGGR